ncbi:hypothetical protein F4778DRAFT_393646 [Xylariomycetidae sp. FL2044]|nr:hypothetical protein F4778DRAFT_393646 [Xylariomycetidae sp. FL2044]
MTGSKTCLHTLIRSSFTLPLPLSLLHRSPDQRRSPDYIHTHPSTLDDSASLSTRTEPAHPECCQDRCRENPQFYRRPMAILAPSHMQDLVVVVFVFVDDVQISFASSPSPLDPRWEILHLAQLGQPCREAIRRSLGCVVGYCYTFYPLPTALSQWL